MQRANQTLSALLSLWNEKRGGRSMASLRDFSVHVLRPWLGNVALIDVDKAGGAAFRIFGTNLIGRFGGEYTRRSISDIRAGIRTSLEQCINAVCRSGQPVQMTRDCTIETMDVELDELYLPLSDTGERVTTVLYASLATRTFET